MRTLVVIIYLCSKFMIISGCDLARFICLPINTPTHSSIHPYLASIIYISQFFIITACSS